MDELSDAQRILDEHRVLMGKLQDKVGIEPSHAISALTEAIRFLTLIASTPGKILTPSQVVDDVWHEFILCTQAYTDFCQERYGRYVHHHPGGDATKHAEQFRQTLGLYQERYGPPPPRYWDSRFHHSTTKANCGSCESS